METSESPSQSTTRLQQCSAYNKANNSENQNKILSVLGLPYYFGQENKIKLPSLLQIAAMSKININIAQLPHFKKQQKSKRYL